MKTIIVLDFTSAKVFVEKIPKKLQGLQGDEILEALDYDEGNCQYMIVDGDIDIEYV